MIPYVNIHTHRPEYQNIELIDLATKNDWEPRWCYSFGLHPWNIATTDLENYLEQIATLINEKKIMAIGEAGVDRVIQTEVELQKQVFNEQVLLSEQFQMPIIIHCVKAWADLSEIRKQTKAKTPWIYHGFTANLHTAQQIRLEGNYLSFGKALLINPKVQAVFASYPIEKIFLETDDSDEKIETIYEKAADLRHISMAELKEAIYGNFITVFGESYSNIG
ncbi:MAG: TatD family hydrolase [Salinivirgaceae bacterium]|jgi:TatD DNase family protein